MNQRYRVRFHPRVRDDLRTIATLISDYSGDAVAREKLAEIEAACRALQEVPHKGTLRDEIAPGLRAIPAGRRAVIAFRVDDGEATVLIYAITYGGADWAGRAGDRSGA